MKFNKNITSSKRKWVNGAIIIIVLAALVGINFVASLLVDRFPALKADVTDTGAYTLNATTCEYLEYLDKPVKVTVLKSEDAFINMTDDNGTAAYSYQVNELLKDMSAYENFQLEYRDITAVAASVLAQEYPESDWSTANNLVIVEYKDKHAILEASDIFSYSSEYYQYYGSYVITGQNIEQEVLSAIQKVTSDRLLKVAFTIGNGEFLNPESKHYTNFSQLKTLFEDNAYEVVDINLLTETPTDEIDAMVMMCPEKDITDAQSEAINNWLINDGNYGKTFMYIPYDLNIDTTNIDLLVEQWGMDVDGGYIYEEDLTMVMAGGSMPQLTAIANYANEEFTQDLKSTTLSMLLPYGINIKITDSEVATPLLTSSEMAKVVLLNNSSEELTFEENGGQPLNYAAIGSKGNAEMSETSDFIVWGSCEGISSGALTASNFNNAPYIINMFNKTLDNQSTGIVVESVALSVEPITVNGAQQTFAMVAFMIVLPLAVFAVGIVVWVRRKNK